MVDDLAARLGVRGGDPVVEEVDDLVGQSRRGLRAEREQSGMAELHASPLDRLCGGVADVLREHPPPVGRNRVQLPPLGA